MHLQEEFQEKKYTCTLQYVLAATDKNSSTTNDIVAFRR